MARKKEAAVSMRCSVYIRGGNEEQVYVDNPATVGNLRSIVRQMLLGRPIHVVAPHHHGRTTHRTTDFLAEAEILIFQNKQTLLLEDDSMALRGDTKYSAFEKFSKVPVDLYRTVKMSQIHPVVKASTPSPFTQVVPLYCATLERKDSIYPPYYSSATDETKEGRVLFRGASLQCCDRYTEVANDILPWAEVTREEDKTGRAIRLEGLQGTYQETTTAEPFGILHTSKLYGPTGFQKFDRKQFKEGANTVKTRNYYWRFKLTKGTNLNDVGMYVVCDKDDGHFCLVPNGDYSHSVMESIAPPRNWGGGPQRFGVQLLVPDPDVDEPRPPEAILTTLIASSNRVVAFPVVAQKFQFHDLGMKAAGLPWDVGSGGSGGDDEDNQDKKKLGDASNVVFEHCIVLPDTYDILCALEALSASEFNFTTVSISNFDLLRSAMHGLRSTEDTIDEAESEILLSGMGVIEKQLKLRAKGTPTLAEVPFEGPLMKVARKE